MSQAEVLRRLDAAIADVARIRTGWQAAATLLDESTGGFPSGGAGPSGISDRTAKLAVDHVDKPDRALSALERRDALMARLMALAGFGTAPWNPAAVDRALAGYRVRVAAGAWLSFDQWSRSVEDATHALVVIITAWQPAERPDPKALMCDNCKQREKAENRRVCGWCHCVHRDTKHFPDAELIAIKDRRENRVTTADMAAFVVRVKAAPRKRSNKRKKAAA